MSTHSIRRTGRSALPQDFVLDDESTLTVKGGHRATLATLTEAEAARLAVEVPQVHVVAIKLSGGQGPVDDNAGVRIVGREDATTVEMTGWPAPAPSEPVEGDKGAEPAPAPDAKAKAAPKGKKKGA